MPPNALVTGASRGIGAAIARGLSEAGYRVFVNYRSDAEGARAVVDHIVAAGGAAEAVKANVGVRAEVEAMYAAIEAAHGFVRCLVNNAGVTRDGLLMLMGESDWDAVLDASLRGTFLCSKTVPARDDALWAVERSPTSCRPAASEDRQPVQLLGGQGRRDRLYKGSSRGDGPPPHPRQRRLPGPHPTQMSRRSSPARARHWSSRSPRPAGTPQDDAAPLVRFLASEDASYITGQGRSRSMVA
jgi:3-oxoacyl-[acyl-carrier protein] reductase